MPSVAPTSHYHRTWAGRVWLGLAHLRSLSPLDKGRVALLSYLDGQLAVQQTTSAPHQLHMPPFAACAGMFATTFAKLHARGARPEVLYPAVAIPSSTELKQTEDGWREGLPAEAAAFIAAGPTFLSINRFERKKVGRCRSRTLCNARSSSSRALH